MSEALRRIPLTTLATAWTGAAPVTQPCEQNTGLAQHQIVLLARTPVTGSVAVSMSPPNSGYFVPVGIAMPPDNLVFRGIFESIMLSAWSPISGGPIDAYINSVATTFNSSAGEAFDEQSRRRVTSTRIVSNWPAQSGTLAATHQLLSQHQLSCASGVGTCQFFASNQSQGLIPIGRPMNAAGDYQIVTGYYDQFAVKAAPAVTGPFVADVVSIAQELITGEDDVPNGGPLAVTDGDVASVPAGAQMLWSVPISLDGRSGLDISGALEGIAEAGEPGAPGGGVPVEIADGASFVVQSNTQMVWFVPIAIDGIGSLELDGALENVS